MSRIYQLEVGQRFSYNGVVYVKTAKGDKLNKAGEIIVEDTGEKVFLPSMTRVVVLLSHKEVAEQPDLIQSEDFEIE